MCEITDTFVSAGVAQEQLLTGGKIRNQPIDISLVNIFSKSNFYMFVIPVTKVISQLIITYGAL